MHIDTGMVRIEDRSGSEFPDLRAAEHAAIEKARNFLMKQRSLAVMPQFFVEISVESGDLLAMLSLRRLLFGEAITDRHRGLCEMIPRPWLRLNSDLGIPARQLRLPARHPKEPRFHCRAQRFRGLSGQSS
jgi:hypothetical protein